MLENLNLKAAGSVKEQEPTTHYYWRGCELIIEGGERSYWLFMEIPKGSDTPHQNIQAHLSSFKQLIRDGRVSLPFFGYPTSVATGWHYYLNHVDLHTTPATNDQDVELYGGSKQELAFVGIVNWGSSGPFSYITKLFVPEADLGHFSKDIDSITSDASDRELMTRLHAHILIPGTNELYDFRFVDGPEE